MNSIQPKVYLTRAGKHGEDEDLALENQIVLVGFREVRSLDHCQSYEEIAALVQESFPDAAKGRVSNFSGQLWALAQGMREDDIVVLPRKATSQIAIGRVAGPYIYKSVAGEMRHTRAVEWLVTEIPRTAFEQDLLYSFGAFMTVCQISRNDAVKRVEAVLRTGKDPGVKATSPTMVPSSTPQMESESSQEIDLTEAARDQIAKHIRIRFAGHPLATLVDAVLCADGWMTQVSSPGADGGVDILAGRGALGLDGPRLCVQVKSQDMPADVSMYRELQGSMQTFNAEQGLLVCLGGFNKAVRQEARTRHFSVRLWDSTDLLEAIFRNYEKLGADIQAEIPLKQVWMLVHDDD